MIFGPFFYESSGHGLDGWTRLHCLCGWSSHCFYEADDDMSLKMQQARQDHLASENHRNWKEAQDAQTPQGHSAR